MSRTRAASLAALALLSGCGGLPRPFQENPGGNALALAAPPPTRLAVPPPMHASLDAASASLLARDLAASLDDREVPAEAIRPVKGDWRLLLATRPSGTGIVPVFTVLQPSGRVRGTIEGDPVDAALWHAADPQTLQSVATGSSQRIADLLTGIQASVREADPNSLMHRPARVDFTGVAGAPGDGDRSLAAALRGSLPLQGDVLTSGGRPPDYTVSGTVAVSSVKDGRQTVEIEWHVIDAKGHEAGKVSQLNAVPAGSLDGAWGPVAQAAASEAASGIHQVIQNNSGVNDKPVPIPNAG